MNKLQQITTGVLLCLTATSLCATTVSESQLEGYTQATQWTRGSVHDPSVVLTTDSEGNDLYYVFGSHMGEAKTSDLRNWTNVTSERTSSPLFGDAKGNTVSYATAFTANQITTVTDCDGNSVNWGTHNASAWNTALDSFTVNGNMWAPDVIWNKSLQKWCMYLSLNGSKWNSSIVLLTATQIEGPYIYQGPVVYSGFNVTTATATDWTLTDMKQALGSSLSALPARYNVGNQWGTYWPHAIDPGVFYDEDGELWMNYGSWSGGIYVLKLDKNTGLRDYTYKYSSDYDTQKASVTSDPYFGKKIAGGYYTSGEGSYIEKIGNYYYLFMSYGFYSPDGGYEMRIFRSSAPDGPYTDSYGTDARYTSYQMNYGTNAATNRGMKLMGNYQMAYMSTAEIAQGHNSAVVDGQGRAFVVYHTKFNDGTAGHALRVHQLFVNQDGWITAAPYEYNGEEATATGVASTPYFSHTELCGTYAFLLHKYKMDYANKEYVSPDNLTLNADGSVSGDHTGTWSTTTGTAYISLTLDGVTYNGVAIPQSVGGSNLPAIGLTAMNTTTGVNIWATKLSDLGELAADYADLSSQVTENEDLYQSLSITRTGSHGSTLTLSSSDTTVIDNEGNVTTPTEDTPVTLTFDLSNGDYTYRQTTRVTAKAGGLSATDIATGINAYYNFDHNLTNQYNNSEVGTASALSSGTAPAYETDAQHGTVLHQYFGYADAQTTSYVTLPNSLKGKSLTGATLSVWVKRLDTDAWDALWSFCSGTFDQITSRLYFTGNTYMGYNGPQGYMDYNHPGSVTLNTLPTNKWVLLTLSYTADGFNLYIDGKLTATESNYGAYADGNNFSKNWQALLDQISAADNLYLGYGSFWGSAPVQYDDLLLYDRALTAGDVAHLYQHLQKGGSLLSGKITATDTAKINKHGVGSSSQTVKKDSALVGFFFQWENATHTSISGLPQGLTAVIDTAQKTITLSGTVTAEAGIYTYTLTTQGGVVNATRSGTITVTESGAGVENIGTGKDRLNIYPNPAQSIFQVQINSPQAQEGQLRLLNAQGQIVESTPWTLQKGTNCKTLYAPAAKGVYSVQIKTPQGQQVRRLIVR